MDDIDDIDEKDGVDEESETFKNILLTLRW